MDFTGKKLIIPIERYKAGIAVALTLSRVFEV
jgi:hypothetical protein